MNYVRIVVRVPTPLAKKIDEAKGDDSMSQFIRDAIGLYLSMQLKFKAQNQVATKKEGGKAAEKKEWEIDELLLRAPDRKGQGKRKSGAESTPPDHSPPPSSAIR